MRQSITVTNRNAHKRGAAMLAAIMFLLVASGIITLIFTSTLSEIRQSGDDVAIVKTLTLARGGANLGGRLLNTGIRDDLEVIALEHASTVNRWPFGDNSDITQAEPTPSTVISDLVDVRADLQKQIDERLCGNTLVPAEKHVVRLTIFVTETACDGAQTLPNRVKLPAARFVSGSVRTYSIPYVLVSTATLGQTVRNIVSQGEYQFKVGGGKFSQFALFTDEHVTEGGAGIWFTGTTLFDGPVHSNGTFRFSGEPWFGGAVTSAGCTNGNGVTCASATPGATFATQGFVQVADLSSTPVYGSDKPELSGGVDWESEYIALPTNALDQKDEAERKGLTFSEDLYSLTFFAGDNNAQLPASDGSGGWAPAATYQYIRVCKTSATDCERYRFGSNKKLYKETKLLDTILGIEVSVWNDQVSADFTGVIHIDGEVKRFSGPARSPASSTAAASAPPALASFAQMTVVPEEGIRITGDLTYENPPCSGTPKRVSGSVQKPSCNNLNAKNVLGVFTPDENILIGNQNTDTSLNAPDNVTLHGSFMASQGVVQVENFNTGSPRGSVNLLGGLIENRYGAFGTFSGTSQTSGYGRNFTFDQRMGLGFSPPAFPGTNPSIVQSVFAYSFGQREQAY